MAHKDKYSVHWKEEEGGGEEEETYPKCAPALLEAFNMRRQQENRPVSERHSQLFGLESC